MSLLGKRLWPAYHHRVVVVKIAPFPSGLLGELFLAMDTMTGRYFTQLGQSAGGLPL